MPIFSEDETKSVSQNSEEKKSPFDPQNSHPFNRKKSPPPRLSTHLISTSFEDDNDDDDLQVLSPTVTSKQQPSTGRKSFHQAPTSKLDARRGTLSSNVDDSFSDDSDEKSYQGKLQSISKVLGGEDSVVNEANTLDSDRVQETSITNDRNEENKAKKSTFRKFVSKKLSPFRSKKKKAIQMKVAKADNDTIATCELASPTSGQSETEIENNSANTEAMKATRKALEILRRTESQNSMSPSPSTVKEDTHGQNNRRISSDKQLYVKPNITIGRLHNNQDNDPVKARSSSHSAKTKKQYAQNCSNKSPTGIDISDPVPSISPCKDSDDFMLKERGSVLSRDSVLSQPDSDIFLSPKDDTKGRGVVSGIAGSGVLLEGWLRQKQRKGFRGMKKWNARYFVLYVKHHEIRYYTDVVSSGWGPIPLHEIGAISLRLIQRISKPSHPKYKGCRFDITCRSSWGTHYAGDYVSSEEESEGNVTSKSIEKSSRVYSLLSDSPQTTSLWMNLLDSLLKRSVNSPRTDSFTLCSSSPLSSHLAKKKINRRKSLEVEFGLMIVAKEAIPRAIELVVDYLESSTPGIEEELFYCKEANSSKLKASINYLNQFTMNSELSNPDKNELEQYIDPVTAGAIVKIWLCQLERPLIPSELWDEFLDIARNTDIDLTSKLKDLLHQLPKKTFNLVEFFIYHLAGVAEYSNKNKMPPSVLANVFAEHVLRPKSGKRYKQDDKEVGKLVLQHLITAADTIIA